MRAPSRWRRIGPSVAVAGLVVAACSVAESLPLPVCTGDSSILIVAQSVPTAEMSLCLGEVDPTVADPSSGRTGNALPSGWERSTVTIDQGGSVIRLDSDRAGADAATLHIAETCDIGEAVPVPSDQDGAQAYEFIERIEPGLRAQRYYVFAGGCVWWDFDFNNGAPAALAVELQNRLFLFDREFLIESVRENFLDEEL